MMDAADPNALRAEHDQLMARLSTRQSTEHFAHAAVSTFIGLILAGAAGKLFWDVQMRFVEWAIAGAAVGVGLLLYALVRYLKGHSALAAEHREFVRLSALRRALGIDDPSSLLPR
ncbi:MAG: hypothetical protein AB1730_10220 [Myxococcota bacterium]